ncbi:MAG: PAS domain S-box protein [Chloroflexota bacterium]
MSANENDDRLRHYQLLVEAAGDVIYVVNWQGFCTYVNNSVKRLFGYNPEEIIGHYFTDYIHPDWREDVQAFYLQQFQDRTPETRREFPAMTRAGEVKWVEQIVILQTEGDRVSGFLGFVRDISRRKRAEDQLRAIIDAVPDHIYVKNREHRFTLVNRATWQNEGFNTQDEMVGLSDKDLYGDESESDWEAEETLFNSGNSIINHEHSNPTPPNDGKRAVVLINKVPLYGEDGEISGLIGINRDITERKFDQDQIRQNENTLHSIIETSTDLMFIKDKDLRYVLFNPAGVRMMGRPVEAILGKNDYDLFDQKVGDQMGDIDRHILATRESTTYEILRPLADGDRWLLITKYPFLSADGEALGIVGLGHDITERKRAEAALQASEANLSALMNNSTDSIFSIDTEHRLITFNLTFEQRFSSNFKIKLVPGMLLTDVVPRRMREDWTPWFNRALKGERFSVEYRYVSNGVPGITDINFNPIRTPDGKITGVAVFNRDVTERIEAEAALRASEQRYRAVVDNQSDLVSRSKPDTTLTFVNDAYCKFFGKTRDELIDHSHLILAPESVHAEIRARIQTWVEKPGTYTQEFRHVLADGKVRWIEWTDHAILDDDGHVVEFQSAGRDITDRRQAELALQASEANLSALMNNTQDSIFSADTQMRVLTLNSTFKTRYKLLFDADIDVGTWLPSTMSTEASEQWMRPFKEALSGKSVNVEQHTSAMDNDFYFDVTYNPIVTPDGRITGVAVFSRDVTAGVLAVHALRENEQRYRAVVDNQTDLIFRFRPDCTLTFVNEAFCKFFGKGRGEILGQNFLTMMRIPRDYHTVIQEKIAQLVENPAPLSHEHPLIDARGILHWQEWTDHAILDDKGQVIEIQTAARDTTRRKLAESALRESEQRYRAVVEYQSDLVSRSMPDTTLTFINDAYCRYFNKSREELIGKSFLMMVPEEAHELIRADFAAMQENPVAHTDQRRYFSDTGEVRWLEWTNNPILNERGEVLEFQSTGRDITDRRRAEEERNEYIARLEILQRMDSELSQTLKLDYVLEMALDAAVRMSGGQAGAIHLLEDDGSVRVAQVIGDYPAEMRGAIWPPDTGIISRVVKTLQPELVSDVTKDPKYVANVSDTESQITIPLISQERLIGTLNVQTRDHSRFSPQIFDFVKLLASRIASALDNARLYYILSKQFEELENVYEHVSGLEQLKSQIIRIAAHDLRNPLGVISGYLQVIDGDTDLILPDRTKEQLKIIGESADRIDKISRDILTLERVQSAQRGINMDTVDLTEMVKSSYNEHVPQAALKSQDFQLLPLPAALKVQGDPMLLRECVNNLISNAIKYTREKGRITVNLTVDKNSAVFEVEDNGYGIPEDQQPNLFKPFYRVKLRETRDIKGTGLGLSLVKSIIERHNGHIRFHSVYGKGSLFGFEMPLLTKPKKTKKNGN